MRAIDTKHIKIGPFFEELRHFEVKLSKLELEVTDFALQCTTMRYNAQQCGKRLQTDLQQIDNVYLKFF